MYIRINVCNLSVHVCGVQQLTSDVFLILSLPYFLRLFLSDPGAYQLARLTGQCSLEILLPPPHQLRG